MRRKVFCEFGFLRKFLGLRPQLSAPDDIGVEHMMCWLSTYKFLGKSELVLDITAGEFRTACGTDPWMMMLWKKHSNGVEYLKFDGMAFPDLENLDTDDPVSLCSVYMTDLDRDACREHSRRYGIIVMNPEMCLECDHLFRDLGTAFPSETARNWSFMNPLKGMVPPTTACNALFIVDEYLFRHDRNKKDEVVFFFKEKLQDNIVPILESILPDSLAKGEKFQVYVFTGECETNVFDCRDYLCSIIKGIRPKLDVEVSFFSKSWNLFHDRTIVTNSIWIGCGRGFGIFHGRNAVDTAKSTNVNIIFPFFQSGIEWADRSYLNLMKDAKEVIRSRVLDKTDSCGNKDFQKNRLLAYYCQEDEKKPASDDVTNSGSSPSYNKDVLDRNLRYMQEHEKKRAATRS